MSTLHYHLPGRWQQLARTQLAQLRVRHGSGCAVHEQACLAPDGGGEGAADGRPPPQPQCEDCREVIYGGDLGAQPGPLPEEALLRLWFALSRPGLTCPIVFTLPPGQSLPELLTALMELTGLGGRALPVSVPTRFARVYDPEPCAGPAAAQGCDAAALSLLPQAAAAALPAAAAGERLYLSRRGGEHQAFGEEYFEDFFAARGYAVIRPAQQRGRELLARIAAASALACTEGPLARLALLARPGTRLTCLCAGRPVARLQLLIAAVRQLECTLVDVGLNLLPAPCGCDGSLIGPSRHWREFAPAAPGEEAEGDVFAWLSTAGPAVGRYISAYLEHITQRRQLLAAGAPHLDHIGYVQALFDAFAPGGFEEVRQALCICEHPFFCGRHFVVRRFGTAEQGVILLRSDGGVEVQGRSTLVLLRRWRWWSFLSSRLNLMDEDCRLAAQFIVTRDDSFDHLNMSFTGTAVDDPALWLSMHALSGRNNEAAGTEQEQYDILRLRQP